MTQERKRRPTAYRSPRRGVLPKDAWLAKPGADTVDLIGYLRSCSDVALEEFELSRMNHSANFAHEAAALVQKAVQSGADALLARTLREHRKALLADGAKPEPFAAELFADLVPVLPEAPNGPKAHKKG